MKKEYLYLLGIILFAVITRIIFFVGHVFSDDSYYSYLSYTITQGNFADDYLGYPIFKLRIGHLYLTALFYQIFGLSEFSTVFPVFLFSLLNIFVAFKVSHLITNSTSTALITAFIISLIPTEIIFASISFVDLPSAVLINVGIYFYLQAKKQRNINKIYIAILFLGMSFLFKETIYFYFFVLLTFLIYELIKKYDSYKYTLVLLVGVIAIPLVEGLIYYFINNDLFYRNHIMKENYNFAFYDFFPNTIENFKEKSYSSLLVTQIIQNIRFIFLRRFYLFLPLLGLVSIFFRYKKGYQEFMIFWFVGLIFSLCCLSVSFDYYRPLNLKNSWYLIPIFIPSALIFTSTFAQIILKHKIIFMAILITGSFYITNQYLYFFHRLELNKVKSYLNSQPAAVIYTNHFTKYGVDHVLNYSERKSTHRILGEEFKFSLMPTNSLLLYNKKHIDELQLQGFQYPDFDLIKETKFKLIKSFGDFKFYQKL